MHNISRLHIVAPKYASFADIWARNHASHFWHIIAVLFYYGVCSNVTQSTFRQVDTASWKAFNSALESAQCPLSSQRKYFFSNRIFLAIFNSLGQSLWFKKGAFVHLSIWNPLEKKYFLWSCPYVCQYIHYVIHSLVYLFYTWRKSNFLDFWTLWPDLPVSNNDV